jgi:hypothetical protein
MFTVEEREEQEENQSSVFPMVSFFSALSASLR